MKKEQLKIETYRFANNDRHYLYDINSGFFSEIDGLFNELVELLPQKSYEEIVEQLGAQFTPEKVTGYLKQLDELTEANEIFVPSFEKVVEMRNNRDSSFVNNLWLNIVHDCNLRCIYCFAEDGTYGSQTQWMNRETARASIDYWFERLNREASNLVVTFFGGEPLLNKEVLIDSVNYIREKCQTINRKPKIRITTNGTIMDDEIMETLVSNSIFPVISIDGGAAIQNKNRPGISGSSSFDKVAQTVQQLKKQYPAIHGRITLIHDNVPDFEQSVKDLWEAGFNNISFAEVSSTDENMALTPGDVKLLIRQIKNLSDITFRNMVAGIPQIFMPLYDKCVLIHNRIIGSECSFEKTETLIITPDGNIHKCHRLLDREEMVIGSIFKGRDRLKMQDKIRNAEKNTACSSCWVRFLCGGGCPQENFIFNNDFNKPYSIKCSLEKALTKEAFNLYTNLYQHDAELLEKIFSK